MGGGQCSLLWLNARIRCSLQKFSDHLLKDVRYFTAGGGHSLLWPDATTFLNHSGASSLPGDAIIACSQRPQSLLSPKSGTLSNNVAELLIQHWGNDNYEEVLSLFLRRTAQNSAI